MKKIVLALFLEVVDTPSRTNQIRWNQFQAQIFVKVLKRSRVRSTEYISALTLLQREKIKSKIAKIHVIKFRKRIEDIAEDRLVVEHQ